MTQSPKLYGDVFSEGRIWRARDQSQVHFRDAMRLQSARHGLVWHSLPTHVKGPKPQPHFQRLVQRLQKALCKLPTWNFRFAHTRRFVRLHGDRGQWLALAPEWRMSWSMISNGMGTQIGSLAIYAKRPPLDHWLTYLQQLDEAHPQLLKTPQSVHFSGDKLAFFLEDSLAHAARKLSQLGIWHVSYPIPVAFDEVPEWWDALLPSTIHLQPHHLVQEASYDWTAVAYDRELHNLIVVAPQQRPQRFYKLELGQPLHRFIKQLRFISASRPNRGLLLKGVQWQVPDAIVDFEGTLP